MNLLAYTQKEVIRRYIGYSKSQVIPLLCCCFSKRNLVALVHRLKQLLQCACFPRSTSMYEA